MSEIETTQDADEAVCDECGGGWEHFGHCDICGKAILSTWRMHDAVYERQTDAEAEDAFERKFER